MRNADTVIVGAGPAGCSVATALAGAGAPPLLLERTPHPAPRICGEFVSAEAASALAAIGIDLAALGARPTRRLRLLHGRTVVDAALPFIAHGLRRCTLDAALQQRAAAAGAVLERGCRVGITALGDSVRPFVLDAGGAAVATPRLVLACGKSDLAPLQRPPRPAAARLVGMQCHLRLAPAQAAALDGTIELLLFDGGYAGLQAVDGGLANLCLLADVDLARRGLGAVVDALRRGAPAFAERLDGAALPRVAEQTIARVPYGHLHRARAGDPPGLWRLGDQGAVIASFTGDGLAIALHTAALASQALRAGDTAAVYHRRLRATLRWQLARAQALYTCAKPALGRRALVSLASRWPALLGFAAALTRVPAAAWRPA